MVMLRIPPAGAPRLAPTIAAVGLSLTGAGKSGSAEGDDHLPGVLAAQQTEEGVGAVLDALDDRLAVLQLARVQPAGHFLDELLLEVGVVADEHALEPQPL